MQDICNMFIGPSSLCVHWTKFHLLTAFFLFLLLPRLLLSQKVFLWKKQKLLRENSIFFTPPQRHVCQKKIRWWQWGPELRVKRVQTREWGPKLVPVKLKKKKKKSKGIIENITNFLFLDTGQAHVRFFLPPNLILTNFFFVHPPHTPQPKIHNLEFTWI
jgi:hypothetical protein